MTEPEPATKGIVMRIPAEIIGAGVLLDLLKPYITNLDATVSSRATPEEVTLPSRKHPEGKVH
jgi:hypothetical protein